MGSREVPGQIFVRGRPCGEEDRVTEEKDIL